MTIQTSGGTTVAGIAMATRIAQGNELLRQGRHAEAVRFAAALAEEFPDQARAFAFAAEASRVAGDQGAALAWIDRAIELGNDPQHKIKKGWLLSRLMRRDEIPALAADIAAQAGADGLLLWQLGKLYYHHNLLPEAIAQYERALALGGEHPGRRYDLAIARFYAGQAEEAERDLDRVLEASPQAGAVVYLRSTLRRQDVDRNHVDDIRARLAAGFRKPDDEAGALYALAKELEDLGEHDQAFPVLVAGADRMRSTLRYDASAFFDTLQQIARTQDAEALAGQEAGEEGEGAVFIVGMPRTGTTLAERILLQSGKVKDAGELTDFGFLLGEAVHLARRQQPSLGAIEATMHIDFAALGARYMQAARQMAGGHPMFIDKLPPNYMYCGMIHRALPKARIIHLVRDPLDSCYAIYKTLFFNAYEFSYDQEELADYYIAYRRLMQHWREAMPGAILDVNYEDLVSDTETQARRIYDWCGLQWTPAALEVPDRSAVFATASAAQVREPVHTRSVHSSRRHLAGLQPMARKLVDAGLLQL